MAWQENWKDNDGTHILVGEGTRFFNGQAFAGRVRIDAYTIATCGLKCGDGVHVSSFVFFNGGPDQTVHLKEWSFVGSGSRLITASDDFTGEHGPIGPWGQNRMDRGDIVFESYSGVAVGVTVLPGVTLPEGCCIAGHGWVDQFASELLRPWTVSVCLPGKRPRIICKRDKDTILAKAADPEFRRDAS